MDQSINFVIETKLRETKPIIIELRSLTAQPIKIHVDIIKWNNNSQSHRV